MQSQSPASRNIAIGLAFLAGFIDALGFLSLGGFFLSFMSGNSTRFSVEATNPAAWHSALLAFALLALFVLGVMLGQAVRFLRPRLPSTAVLSLVSALLLAAAIAVEQQQTTLAVLLMATAMGASNNAFMRGNEVSIGVTYMTGTLVRFGQNLAARLLGDRSRRWFPYLLLWSGLLAGAVTGAFCWRHWGLHALWIAVGCYPLLTLAMRGIERRRTIEARTTESQATKS